MNKKVLIAIIIVVVAVLAIGGSVFFYTNSITSEKELSLVGSAGRRIDYDHASVYTIEVLNTGSMKILKDKKVVYDGKIELDFKNKIVNLLEEADFKNVDSSKIINKIELCDGLSSDLTVMYAGVKKDFPFGCGKCVPENSCNLSARLWDVIYNFSDSLQKIVMDEDNVEVIWSINDAPDLISNGLEIPQTKVLVSVNGKSYNVGIYNGSCSNRSVSQVACWYGGIGEEIILVRENGKMVVKTGYVDSQSPGLFDVRTLFEIK
jgi:hypothetical protein